MDRFSTYAAAVGNHGRMAWILWLPLLALLVGCDAGAHPTAPVTGKVIYQGQPVTGGTITLIPMVSSDKEGMTGKPASGKIQSDGSFTLGTYE